jgi:hypothetical protein
MGPRDEPIHADRVPLEGRLDGAVGKIAHPACYALLLGESATGVPEEHPVHIAGDDHPLADHVTNVPSARGRAGLALPRQWPDPVACSGPPYST